jgi:hypothetical protein
MYYEEVGVHIPLCEAVHGWLGYSGEIEEQSEGAVSLGRGTESVAWSCNSVPREKEGGAVC